MDKKIKLHNTSDSFSSAIVKIYKDVGAIESLNLDDDLRKLGFDSLMLSQAAGKIMGLYGEEYDIKFDELLRVSLSDGTIDKIILYIKNAKREKILIRIILKKIIIMKTSKQVELLFLEI